MLVKKLKNAINSKDKIRINEAFNEFYNEYFKLIYYIISQYIDNQYDIEDLTQDVFVNFFNNIMKIDLNKNVKYYLITMAKNTSINFLKSKNKKIIFENDFILSIVDEESKIDKVLYENIIESLSNVLSDVEVKIIILHILEGKKFKDIADDVNMSINTVLTTYYRAINKFKKKVGNVYYD